MSHEGEAPQAEAPQDRRSVIADALTEIETEQTQAPAQTSEPAQAEGRARAPDGKFIPKAPAVEAAPQVQTPQPQPWHRPPKSWKKEVAAGWEKLDPTYQQYVHEREQQMHAGIEPLLPKAELADKITKAAEPYINTIRGLGIDLPTAISGLMKADNDLRTLPYPQKLELLANIAASYGIDLTGQMQQAQPTYTPLVQQLQNKVIEIEGRFTSMAEQQAQAERFAAQQEIQSFADTAEYFDEAKPTMISLLQSGMATTIKEAYDKAIRLDPDLFDQIQSAKQAAVGAEKRKAADDAAKRARGAAVSVKSATPGAKTPANAQDRRSILREQIEGLSERF